VAQAYHNSKNARDLGYREWLLFEPLVSRPSFSSALFHPCSAFLLNPPTEQTLAFLFRISGPRCLNCLVYIYIYVGSFLWEDNLLEPSFRTRRKIISRATRVPNLRLPGHSQRTSFVRLIQNTLVTSRTFSLSATKLAQLILLGVFLLPSRGIVAALSSRQHCNSTFQPNSIGFLVSASCTGSFRPHIP